MRIKPIWVFCFALIIQACQPRAVEKDGMVLISGDRDIKDFWLDVSPVTVEQFGRFVKATNYKTEAEKFGDGGAFDFELGVWKLQKGVSWQHPFGNDTAKPDHPVTMVSWNDAAAYARWAGKRLPTSQEFVFAEKNGEADFDKAYTWGEHFKENGMFKANFWQGTFPGKNTVEDGFLTTSPVGHFGKNKLGLTDMGGNVWQWCQDESEQEPGQKVQRGGSYLCDPMVCHGFKVGGKATSSPETSLVHVGFRCAKTE